jgi:hypothetical protein
MCITGAKRRRRGVYVRGEALRNAPLFVGDSVRASKGGLWHVRVGCWQQSEAKREEPRDLKPV